MDKRRFLAAGALGAAAPLAASAATHAASGSAGPTLLTVSGAMVRPNRGPLDPALDQLMVRHGVAFERACAFDAAALARLPALTIEPTIEYDGRPHRLRGPLLATVLQAAGVGAEAQGPLALRALDGYTVKLPLAEARGWRMIVATHLDGRPLGLGGLGPLWGVYDADRLPAFAGKPLKERFAQSPWGLYSIELGAA